MRYWITLIIQGWRWTGGCNKIKALAKTKVYQVLIAVTVSVTVYVKLHMLEYIHEILCESKIILYVE
jgi:hypothetical protein